MAIRPAARVPSATCSSPRSPAAALAATPPAEARAARPPQPAEAPESAEAPQSAEAPGAASGAFVCTLSANSAPRATSLCSRRSKRCPSPCFSCVQSVHSATVLRSSSAVRPSTSSARSRRRCSTCPRAALASWLASARPRTPCSARPCARCSHAAPSSSVCLARPRATSSRSASASRRRASSRNAEVRSMPSNSSRSAAVSSLTSLRP
mmetsp:Transcript_68939/g.223466  ORF Transcript_68939/g.223466 Transcript_68939/m.223466 type:complete len:209 (-) Transcript_68939:143-769(-)